MKAGPRRSLYKLKRLLKANKYRTDLTKVCYVSKIFEVLEMVETSVMIIQAMVLYYLVGCHKRSSRMF
jgi:hypothetical protein